MMYGVDLAVINGANAFLTSKACNCKLKLPTSSKNCLKHNNLLALSINEHLEIHFNKF